LYKSLQVYDYIAVYRTEYIPPVQAVGLRNALKNLRKTYQSKNDYAGGIPGEDVMIMVGRVAQTIQ
jgi:hypothetical protein